MSLNTDNAEPGNAARFGVVIMSTTIVVLVVMTYSLFVTLRSEVAELPGTDTASPWLTGGFPQGWAFFTRSPRSMEPDAWQLKDGELAEQLAIVSNFDEDFIFGLDRTPRSQGFELGALQNALNADDWHDCEGPLSNECVSAAISQIDGPLPTAPNPVRSPTVCGPLVLVRSEAVPWAYANRGLDTEPPARIKPLVSECL